MPFGKRRRALADALLHFFKDLAGNDGFMVVTNEVLRQFAEVGAVDLAEIPGCFRPLTRDIFTDPQRSAKAQTAVSASAAEWQNQIASRLNRAGSAAIRMSGQTMLRARETASALPVARVV